VSTEVTVTFTADWRAAYDVLLSIEARASRMYAGRANDPEQQERYNALGPIVFALRDAVDNTVS
jgi:hypothetical protein